MGRAVGQERGDLLHQHSGDLGAPHHAHAASGLPPGVHGGLQAPGELVEPGQDQQGCLLRRGGQRRQDRRAHDGPGQLLPRADQHHTLVDVGVQLQDARGVTDRHGTPQPQPGRARRTGPPEALQVRRRPARLLGAQEHQGRRGVPAGPQALLEDGHDLALGPGGGASHVGSRRVVAEVAVEDHLTAVGQLGGGAVVLGQDGLGLLGRVLQGHTQGELGEDGVALGAQARYPRDRLGGQEQVDAVGTPLLGNGLGDRHRLVDQVVVALEHDVELVDDDQHTGHDLTGGPAVGDDGAGPGVLEQL